MVEQLALERREVDAQLLSGSLAAIARASQGLDDRPAFERGERFDGLREARRGTVTAGPGRPRGFQSRDAAGQIVDGPTKRGDLFADLFEMVIEERDRFLQAVRALRPGIAIGGRGF